MKVTYQSMNYRPEAVLRRYVMCNCWDGKFQFCEVGENRRYDLRQGIVEAGELPEAVRLAALERKGYIPGYVDWPMNYRHQAAKRL